MNILSFFTFYTLVNIKMFKNGNKIPKIVKIGMKASDIYPFDFMKRNHSIMYKFHKKMNQR